MCPPILALTGVAAAGGVANAVMTNSAERFNADLSEQRATQERAAAKDSADRHRLKVRALIGSQRAGFAKAGVRMEGTPANILADTAAQGEKDALLIMHGGELRARDAEARAKASRFAGRQALFSMPFTVGSTVLGGVTAAREFGEI